MRDERSLGLAEALGFNIWLWTEGIVLPSVQGVSHAVPARIEELNKFADIVGILAKSMWIR